MNDSDNFWQNATDMVRALHGCPRTERVVQTYVEPGALGQNTGAMHQAVAPPTSTTRSPIAASFSSFPSRLIQGAMLTSAMLSVVIGVALNANIFTTALTGGVGAAIGGVATSVNKKRPEDEAKKLLLAAGDRYARNGDLDKLTMVKEILGDMEAK